MHARLARLRTMVSGVLMATTLTIGVAACSDDTVIAPALVATNITINSGSDAQSGTVGQAVLSPVSVRITNQNGASMANVTVSWSVASGGGTIGNVTTTTDASGNATVLWSLGLVAGTNTLKASIANGKFVTITATGVAATAAGLSVVSGNSQTLAGGGTSAPLVVKAVNATGAALAGVVISWTTTGGTLGTSSAVTGIDGTASTTLNVAAASGARTVTATAGAGVTSTFTVTGN